MREEIDDLMHEDEFSLNIDFGKGWQIIKRHWKTVMWWAVGGFVVGCLLALATPHKFTCVSKLAPELSSTATNRLSSVASMIGMSSTMLGTTDAVYPMVYPELVHSPEFIVDLFDMPVDFVDKKDSVHTTLYDYIRNYYGQTPVRKVLFAPMALFGKVMDAVRGEDDGDSDSETVFDSFCLTRAQGKVYKTLSKCIEAQIDKKTLVVTIKTSLDNRYICAHLGRQVNDNLKKYVTRYRIEKAIHDRDYYQRIHDESLQEYIESQNHYSRYVDSHQGIVLQRFNVERDRLKNDVSLKYQLYSASAQQLQSAEAKVQLETPVFAEIVTPTTPLISVNSRKKKALGFMLAAMLIGCAGLLVKYHSEE